MGVGLEDLRMLQDAEAFDDAFLPLFSEAELERLQTVPNL